MEEKTEKGVSKEGVKSVLPTTKSEVLKAVHPVLMSEKEFFSKVRHNHFDIVKQQVELDFDLSAQDEKGNTALHISCQNNHKKIAAFLIENGIDINAVNNQGKTALDYCDLLKYTELAHYLVLQGAENNSTLESVPSPTFLSTADISKSFR